MLPGLLLLIKKRRIVPVLLALLCATLSLAATGCGGSPDPNLRYVTPGAYQYQVTASSTSGIQITQSVTVTLVVTN
jgi:hypothetical protein